ncbi:MAG: phage tail sheath subtilisin-like domain-containing protein [Oxalobacter formigenes]|nr:phage tail sheath subtilisin-like domain-containing protein [Oxalobacter formigenes]
MATRPKIICRHPGCGALIDLPGYCERHRQDAWQLSMNDTSGRWSYLKQLYGHVFSARRGTLADLAAFGKTRNDQHQTIVAMEPNNPVPASDFAAAYTAREAVFIRVDPARPTQTGELNGILPARAHDRFIMQERQVLLNAGLATATVSAGGVPLIERAITTYRVNAYGEPDVSYLDSETLFTLATITRRLRSLITSKYGRHKLADDGTKFGAGQAIVTPAIIRSELIAEYDRMERAGLVENADLFAEYLTVERSAGNPNRLDVLFPPDLINQLRILGLLNQFRLQYQTTGE